MKHSFSLRTVFTIFISSLILCVSSCSDGRLKLAENIDIMELMASNRTGILTDKGKTADWIELKNSSSDSIDLSGFKLSIDKLKVDSVSGDTIIDNNTWEFPKGFSIKGGQNIVVFTTGKEDEWKPGKSLIASFKLPKEGGTVKFVSPKGKVLKELTYGEMKPDQSLAMQADSTYAPTYWQSPGYDNTPEGHELAVAAMDKQRKGPLLIWEFMTRANNSKENWVEIKNVGKSDVNLSDYSLSKKGGKKEAWQMPERVLKPGEIISIRLAGKNAKGGGDIKAPFKAGNAETIVLTTKDGKFVDGANAKLTPIGGSIGRTINGKGFYYFSSPTRGEENTKEGKRFIADTPEFDQKPGVYGKTDKLTLRLKDSSRKVHYTLDGSTPTASSPVLKDSLTLTKSTVVRTFVEGDNVTMRSPIATNTFLLDSIHEIAVMNITVNHDDLYSHSSGIYADGPGYTPEHPHKGANYWKNWTKKAHVEFFDNVEGREGFSTDCGLKIFGGFSRAEAKKSFRLKFGGQYGQPEVEYDFFDNGEPMELEDIVIRSGSQDWNRCMVRDEFFTSLMQEQSPELLTQLYRPVSLYINGNYFGLYYLREKINKDFVARKLDIPNDSINIIFSLSYNELGTKEAYNNLMKYVANNDMSKTENYNYVKNNVDLLGLIDYKLGEIFSGNTDVGNIRYVRSTHPDSDKKWHFVFYDLDASWVGYKPGAEYYLATNKESIAPHNRLINSLLKNKEFRQLFLERLSHHMTNTFSTKNTTEKFDKLVATIRPEMKRNCERWPQLSYSKWEKNIADFRAKFTDKPKIMLDDLRQYLNVTNEENKKYFGNLGY